jgi:hypothetical protein|nr:MAG TPA_asm: hypothetical protein [Caudoviricetes sp.]
MQDVSGMFHKREIGVRNDTYTRAEIDAKDGTIQVAADKAQETADSAVSVNNTQNTQIAALQKSAHSHSNKDVLDKTEQPYTTAERDKLAGLENYTHPTHTAYSRGLYNITVDSEGHVIGATAITKGDITSLGIPGANTTYTFHRDESLNWAESQCNKLQITKHESGVDTQLESIKLIPTVRVSDGFETSGIVYFLTVDSRYCKKDNRNETMWNGDTYDAKTWIRLNTKYSGPVGYKSSAALESEVAIVAPEFIGANATNQKQGLMSPEDKANVDANTAARHTHANKSILDQLNETQWKIINGAANKAHVHDNKNTLDKITDALWNTVYSNTHTHDNKAVLDGTTASYTTVEKTKLAGIADGANKYVHPTTSGNKHIPSGGSSGQILRWSADGTAVWGADNNTTYSDVTQSAHGLMTAADKKKLDGMDLSKYLPLAGGKMTGDIDMQTNKKDIYIGSHKQTSDHPSAVAGGSYEVDNDATTTLKNYRSLVGTFHNTKTGNWFNMISVRHRNGYSDGVNYGMYLISALTSGGNLIWNKQTAANKWQGERVLLDSGNYTDYALGKSATASAASKLSTARKINTIAFDGTADIVIPRSTKYMNASSGTGGQTGYVKVATFTVKSQYTNMPTVVRYRNRHTMPVELIFRFKNQSKVDPELEFILQVVELTDYGYKEAYLYKSATSTWDLIIAKSEAWDSVQILDCQQADGVSVTFENTHVSTVPSTAIRATVYTRAMVTSTVAAAKTLTDSGWVAVSNFGVNTSSFSQITTSFRKYGDIIFIRGRVQPKSNMTSISLCSTASTSLTGITPSHSVHGVGVSSDGLAPFSVNVTTSPANSVILKGNFLADKIYDFEFSYMK